MHCWTILSWSCFYKSSTCRIRKLVLSFCRHIVGWQKQFQGWRNLVLSLSFHHFIHLSIFIGKYSSQRSYVLQVCIICTCVCLFAYLFVTNVIKMFLQGLGWCILHGRPLDLLPFYNICLWWTGSGNWVKGFTMEHQTSPVLVHFHKHTKALNKVITYHEENAYRDCLTGIVCPEYVLMQMVLYFKTSAQRV